MAAIDPKVHVDSLVAHFSNATDKIREGELQEAAAILVEAYKHLCKVADPLLSSSLRDRWCVLCVDLLAARKEADR